MNLRPALFTGVLALAAALAPLHAGSRTSLGYRMKVADSFSLNIAYNASVPTQGPISGSIATKTRVEAVLADFLRLRISISSGNYALGMGEDLSPAGNASNISGVDMANERDAMVARNIASIGVPALPDSDVVVGTTWEAERPVYLPKAPFPGVPSVVRVRFVYKVASIAQENGREIVTIAVTGTHPSGQSVKVRCAGHWIVAGGTGKPISAKLEGEASLRVVVTDMKLPFKLEASTATAAERVSR